MKIDLYSSACTFFVYLVYATTCLYYYVQQHRFFLPLWCCASCYVLQISFGGYSWLNQILSYGNNVKWYSIVHHSNMVLEILIHIIIASWYIIKITSGMLKIVTSCKIFLKSIKLFPFYYRNIEIRINKCKKASIIFSYKWVLAVFQILMS